jgi:hypothetical protein
MINPRLVFGGHTHHACHLEHPEGIQEYSISSFNWRNKYNPSYMLALFTMNNYSVKTCHMPQEHTIALIYLSFAMILLFKLKIKMYSKTKETIILSTIFIIIYFIVEITKRL